jgi:hypothetical protein
MINGKTFNEFQNETVKFGQTTLNFFNENVSVDVDFDSEYVAFGNNKLTYFSDKAYSNEQQIKFIVDQLKRNRNQLLQTIKKLELELNS